MFRDVGCYKLSSIFLLIRSAVFAASIVKFLPVPSCIPSALLSKVLTLSASASDMTCNSAFDKLIELLRDFICSVTGVSVFLRLMVYFKLSLNFIAVSISSKCSTKPSGVITKAAQPFEGVALKPISLLNLSYFLYAPVRQA